MPVQIRPARQRDIPDLVRIEQEADRLFAAVGMDLVTQLPVAEPDEYLESLADGRLLVAETIPVLAENSLGFSSRTEPHTADGDIADFESARSKRASFEIVGFARIELLSDEPHLEQLSVDPRYARQGVGTSLLHACESWCRAHRHPEMTLCTFRDVPWNAPFYAKHGWRVLPPSMLTPALQQLVDHEQALGLTRWPRVVMMREITATHNV